jgi:hypothetical protein
MEMHEKGLPVLGMFVASGQPSLCTNHDIQQLVDDFEERTGQIQTSKDAAKIMTDLQAMKLQQRCNVDIVQKLLTKLLANNYVNKNSHISQPHGITLYSWQAKERCLLFSPPL